MEKETLDELTRKYNELDNEAGKYNRPEFDAVYQIISELVKDRDDVGDKGNLAFPLVTGDVINEALKRAGFADDEAFISDFMKYREIEQKAREVQSKGMNLYLSQIPSAPKPSPNGWRFCPIEIFAPQQFVPIIDNILKADAKAGDGLFSNVTDIPEADEGLDEFLMIEAFGLKCSFMHFLDELRSFGVVGDFFNRDFTRLLFAYLKKEAEFIKENTDTPAKVKNHIISTLKNFDGIPVWGLFFQILILQGLCRWLEGVNINEGDNGYDEAQSLYDWISLRLIDTEALFCRTPYGETDKEILKPLCDYLYSTEIGKFVQTGLFGDSPQSEIGDIVQTALGDSPQPKLFMDYLHHDNKPALMEKLHALLDGKKGKVVALTIKALQKLGYVAGYKSNSALFDTMREEFGEIGTPSGINTFLYDPNKKLSDSDISTYVEILKAVE